jgi:hypothetical protein
MKIIQLARGSCVTDAKMIQEKTPSNDGDFQKAIMERLLDLSDAGESIPKGYEDKSKEDAPRKRASVTTTAVKRYKKRPASHVGKMEGVVNPPGKTNHLDTRLTPVHRYVLETNFPILFKEAEFPTELLPLDQALDLMGELIGEKPEVVAGSQNQTRQQGQNTPSQLPSYVTPEFWKQYKSLSPEGQKAVYQTYQKWKTSPQNPALGFRAMENNKNVWRIDCGLRFRAAARRTAKGFEWFYCGTHEHYNHQWPKWTHFPQHAVKT